jgi:citrate lyase beta subunit
MEVADVLDAAMYDRRVLRMETKMRGVIVGMPDAVDEFDTDPDRLGYYVALSETRADTVFLDEVFRITDAKTGEVLIDVTTAAPQAVAV